MPRTHGPAHPLHLHVVPDGGFVSHVLGVPVAVRGSVLVLFALLGWAVDGSPDRVAYWALFGTLTLLVTHVAQGVLARRSGLGPSVELSWIGGLTRWHTTDAPDRPSTLRALGAGPLAALTLAGLASLAALVVEAGGRQDALSEIATDALAVLRLAGLGVAAVELLPARTRTLGRTLHALLPGRPIRRTVRVATLSALVAGPLVVALLLARSWLAIVPAFYLVTDGWIALRGERTIGRGLPDAVAHHDWRTVRRRVLAGCDAATGVAAAQQAFLDRGNFEAAAEIGDAALTRWPLIGFALRTARARLYLEQPDLALARVRDAVRFGADPGALARERAFRSLTTSERWPRAREDVATPDTSTRLRFSASGL